MKKLTAMLFTLMVAVAMTMPAFAAGQQTQGDENAPAQSQTTPKKHKKTKKKKSSKKHHKGSTSSTTTPPPQ